VDEQQQGMGGPFVERDSAIFFSFKRSDIRSTKLVQDALDLLGCRHCWTCLEEFCHANGGFLKGEVRVT